MAVAIQNQMGAWALDFAQHQLIVAEGDMVAVWAAIVTHLETVC